VLASTLNFTKQNPIYGCLMREVLGSNVPHSVLVKTVDEGVDQGIQQLSSTALCYGGGALAHVAWDVSERLLKLPADKANFGRTLGKTSAIYGFASFGLLAVPYLRNAITLQRTKKKGFVGFAGVKTEEKAPVSGAELKQQVQSLFKKFGQTMGAGALFSAGCFAATQLLLKKVASPVPLLKPLTDRLLVPEGNYLKAGDAFALFTAIPAYAGVILGARDIVERQEWLVKAASFPLGVMVVPWLGRLAFDKVLVNKPFKWAGGPQNAGSLFQLALSTGIYASITLWAMQTRKDRADKAGLTPKEVVKPAEPVSTAQWPATVSPFINPVPSLAPQPFQAYPPPLPPPASLPLLSPVQPLASNPVVRLQPQLPKVLPITITT
jgi:hypothetical protein